MQTLTNSANLNKRMDSNWTFYSVTDISAESVIGEQIKLLDETDTLTFAQIPLAKT